MFDCCCQLWKQRRSSTPGSSSQPQTTIPSRSSLPSQEKSQRARLASAGTRQALASSGNALATLASLIPAHVGSSDTRRPITARDSLCFFHLFWSMCGLSSSFSLFGSSDLAPPTPNVAARTRLNYPHSPPLAYCPTVPAELGVRNRILFSTGAPRRCAGEV